MLAGMLLKVTTSLCSDRVGVKSFGPPSLAETRCRGFSIQGFRVVPVLDTCLCRCADFVMDEWSAGLFFGLKAPPKNRHGSLLSTKDSFGDAGCRLGMVGSL